IARQHEWIEVPADERSIVCAVRHLMRKISSHGYGRVSFTGRPIHLIADDGIVVRQGPDGWPVVRVRTLYFHEKLAKESP
ncbi:MAG TPA: hypothetical protein VJU58_14645, partial [Microbacterium sp.]|nr:hypothetical protein [Microbacterium sp.]